MDYSTVLSKTVQEIKPSGIRKFFDIASEMDHVISLSIGEPDFKTPWDIRKKAIYTLEKGRTWYSANSGMADLRIAISKYLERRFRLCYCPDNELLVTVGGSEAIDMSIRAMVTTGDEVLIPEPCFVCYAPIVTLSGGIPVSIPTKAENAFRLTAEELKEKITEKTKLLILPFPNNPTGAVMRRNHLEEIATVLRNTNIMILSDEIYAELTYNGQHVSIANRRYVGTHHRRKRIFQNICNDRMEIGLCSRSRPDYQANDQNSSICNYVCAYYQSVCRY